MSDRKFSTIINVADANVDDLDRVLSAIAGKDRTFAYGIRHQRGGAVLVVYSTYQSQAKKRGEWLTNKVEALKGLTYRVQLDEEVQHVKEAESLQERERATEQSTHGVKE